MTRINPEWKKYNDLNNEGGEGFNPHPKFITDAWTPKFSIEETIALRAKWNGWLAEEKAAGRKVGSTELQAKIKEFGFNPADLKAAVEFYKL